MGMLNKISKFLENNNLNYENSIRILSMLCCEPFSFSSLSTKIFPLNIPVIAPNVNTKEKKYI